ncbi:MAG: TatD family hydrolase [Muribaculaceae bacterium]|nr:TatD family hydrolase [Muribaculaceae bacterium]
MILDIHTHSMKPNPEAVIDLSSHLRESKEESLIPEGYSPEQRFSVGIHPWTLIEEISPKLLEKVEKAAQHPQVAIIGETGIDIPKGGPLFRQMLVFKQMIELSEKVGKPLLIHNVKAHDVIIGIHKELQPRQPWIIHGFRNKPTIAEMFIREGIYLSFGQYFNPATVHNAPHELILAETDESELPIREIIHLLSDARGTDLTHFIAENGERLVGAQA